MTHSLFANMATVRSTKMSVVPRVLKLKKTSKVIVESSGDSIGKVLPFMPLSDSKDKPASLLPGADK